MRLTRAVLMILPGLLSIPVAFASPSQPINVLVMHWYDRGYPSNDLFDRSLQTALEASAPQGVEYYSEYLETNRFPGDEQARLLSEYLRQKYAGRKLDVIISGVSRSSPQIPERPFSGCADRVCKRSASSCGRCRGGWSRGIHFRQHVREDFELGTAVASADETTVRRKRNVEPR
jgi:hypothetical protein